MADIQPGSHERDKSTASHESIRIPVIEESAHVSKRKIETGRVRIRKEIVTEDVHLTESLERETVEIERVPRNEVLSAHPETRMEGDTMVIPVVEEVVEITKKLVLKEEIHLRRKLKSSPEEVSTTINKEVVTVERLPPQTPAAPEQGE